MRIFLQLATFIAACLFTVSCQVEGCTDEKAQNYDAKADTDDGTCTYNYGGREYGQLTIGSQDVNVLNYSIYIDGTYSGTVNKYFSKELTCGNTSALLKTIYAGTHTIKAESSTGIIRECSVTLAAQECLVVLIENMEETTGSVMFYTASDLGYGNITVKLGSLGSRTITKYSSSTPGCGTDGCATFTDVPPGTYSYSATCTYSIVWSGTITTSIGCKKIELTGTGTNSNTGTDVSTGNITFWTGGDSGDCGTITVTLGSYGQRTVNYSYASSPGCGATGCATYTGLPYGTYSYSATSTGGCSWNGSVTLSSSCSMMQLVGN